MKDRPVLNQRTLLRANKSIEIEVPVPSLDNSLPGMQLRQLTPDVISNVVVRFVMSLINKVFYTHNFKW